MTTTFIMCKPDAVERGLVGEIVSRIERKGLRIVAMDMRVPDTALAEAHYEEHADKPFFGELVTFLTRGPVVAMVVEVCLHGALELHLGRCRVERRPQIAGGTRRQQAVHEPERQEDRQRHPR